MKINFNAQGKERGKLVKIIAETLNQESTYLKAPTYNYEIGAFTITREGELEFDTADVNAALYDALWDAFESEMEVNTDG